MYKDYKGYSSDQLLTDDFFLDSQRNPMPETELFWKEQEEKDTLLALEIGIAREMLAALESRGPRMSSAEKALLWKKIHREAAGRKSGRKLWAAIGTTAAAAVILFGVYVFVAGDRMQEIDYISMIESMNTDESNTGSVQLMISDQHNITLEGNETFVTYDADGKVVANNELVIDAQSDQADGKSEIQYNRLIVPAGKRSQVTLSDGTRMWVNSGSRVVYPAVFAVDKREIFTEGEIYLEVAKDASKPFLVKSNSLDVTVLGTSFNFSAYRAAESSVVVVEGSVKVESAGKRSDILQPGQMLTLDDQVSIRNVTTYDYIAWKDGFYIFRNETLLAILGKISDYYGVGIDYNRNVDNIKCSGKLAFSENLEAVISTLNDVVPQAMIKLGESTISVE